MHNPTGLARRQSVPPRLQDHGRSPTAHGSAARRLPMHGLTLNTIWCPTTYAAPTVVPSVNFRQSHRRTTWLGLVWCAKIAPVHFLWRILMFSLSRSPAASRTEHAP